MVMWIERKMKLRERQREREREGERQSWLERGTERDRQSET